MTIPTKFTKGLSSGITDSSQQYAEKTAQMLLFVDARNPENCVSFSAFLSGFSQSFTSNWNTEEVLGRMDPIATFKNTTRSISFGWEVVASDKNEAGDNLDRCNNLVNLLYPSYDDAANALVMARPPLIRLKYANLVRSGTNSEEGLLGFLTSVNWNPVLEMGYIHDGSNIYPKVISVSVEFTAIHEKKLGYNSNGDSLDGEWKGKDGGFGKNWPFGTD